MITKKKREIPQINTTALPDIIFMLLFFFMVVTVIKDSDQNSDIEIPDVSFAHTKPSDEINLKIDLGIRDGHIYYSLNNAFQKDLLGLIESIQEKHKVDAHSRIKAMLKVDKEILMKEVNLLKKELRKLNILNVQYIINQKM